MARVGAGLPFSCAATNATVARHAINVAMAARVMVAEGGREMRVWPAVIHPAESKQTEWWWGKGERGKHDENRSQKI